MTTSAPVFDADGNKLAMCCYCRSLWLPIAKMKARNVGNRKLHYCSGCWSARADGMRRRAGRMKQ